MAKFWKLLKLNNIYMVIYYRILSTLLCVAPGGRWFPTLGKFTMNLIGPKENKGERLRIKGFYSHISVSLHSKSQLLASLSLHVRSTPSCLVPQLTLSSLQLHSKLPCLRKNSGQVPGDWWVPVQVSTGTQERTASPPTPAPEFLWLASGSATGKHAIDVQTGSYMSTQWALSKPVLVKNPFSSHYVWKFPP